MELVGAAQALDCPAYGAGNQIDLFEHKKCRARAKGNPDTAYGYYPRRSKSRGWWDRLDSNQQWKGPLPGIKLPASIVPPLSQICPAEQENEKALCRDYWRISMKTGFDTWLLRCLQNNRQRDVKISGFPCLMSYRDCYSESCKQQTLIMAKIRKCLHNS